MMIPSEALFDIQKIGDAMADLLQGFWGPVLRAVGVLAVLATLAVAAVRWMRRRKWPPLARQPDTEIAVDALPELGPPLQGPRLLYRGVPVRLAAVVLAPPGLARELPPINRLGEVFEALLPGLTDVIRAHRPLYRRWPPQVSTRGFVHRFFAETHLVGAPGTGTPWCLLAGPLAFQQQPLLIGLVLRAESPVHLGRYVVEEPWEWPRLLSVEMPRSSAGP